MQHDDEARQCDPLDRAQIDDEGAQIVAEGRARREVGGWRRLEAIAAARAHAAHQCHPRNIRFDGGNLDPVVALAGELRRVRDIDAATLAMGGAKFPPRGRVGVKRPVRAGMGLGFCLGRRGRRRLLPLRRRQARIVRRLGRLPEFGLQFRHSRRENLNLLRQRLDRLGLRPDQVDQRFLVQSSQRFTIHPNGESVTVPAVNRSKFAVNVFQNRGPLSNYPLPDPQTALAREIVEVAKAIYAVAGTPKAGILEAKLNPMIWRAFGLRFEEVTR